MRSYKDIHVLRMFKGVIGEFLLAFEIEMKEIKKRQLYCIFANSDSNKGAFQFWLKLHVFEFRANFLESSA